MAKTNEELILEMHSGIAVLQSHAKQNFKEMQKLKTITNEILTKNIYQNGAIAENQQMIARHLKDHEKKEKAKEKIEDRKQTKSMWIIGLIVGVIFSTITLTINLML